MIFDAAKKGLDLWLTQLFPALFPFLILSNLFLSYASERDTTCSRFDSSKKRILGLSSLGFYNLFMGHFCGYPVGAKITKDLYLGGQISRKEANLLLAIANQASPAFLASYATSYCLRAPQLIPYVFLILYLGTFLSWVVCYLFSRRGTEKRKAWTLIAVEKISFFEILDKSIWDAFSTLIRVGGYVILFSVLSGMLLSCLPLNNTQGASLSALLEMTNGLSALRQLDLSTKQAWIPMMLCVAFGGFSTLAQIKGMLIGTSLSLKPYIVGKCVYTIIVYVLARLFSICFLV